MNSLLSALREWAIVHEAQIDIREPALGTHVRGITIKKDGRLYILTLTDVEDYYGTQRPQPHAGGRFSQG